MMDKSFVEKEINNQPARKSQVVIGLDIGTTKIACFVGRKNEHNKHSGKKNKAKAGCYF